MESREKYLTELREYIDKMENEVTMILQKLQWDRNRLLQDKEKVICKFDSNHIIPVDIQNEHEIKCNIKSQGYAEDDLFLPEPLNPNAHTVVKLSSDDIKNIIDEAAKSNPLFKRSKIGDRNDSQPLTLERLQATYTADERRAINDAVVNTVPAFHDLSDLALPSDNAGAQKQKSRLQVLAELRDMKRRRTRYRVAVPTKNYSHILRDVISTQMELYTGAQNIKTEPKDTTDDKIRNGSNHHSAPKYTQMEKHRTNTERERFREKDTFRREEKRNDGRYPRQYYSETHSTSTNERDNSYYRHDDRKRHHNFSERDGYSSSSRSRDSRGERSERDRYSSNSKSRDRERNKRDGHSSSRSYDRHDRSDDRHHSKKERYRSYENEKRRNYNY